MLIILNQRDPRWANAPLGHTPYKIGKYGCLVTCISMLSSYFQPFMDPTHLAKILRFTDSGLLIWSSVHFAGFEFYRREYCRNNARIKEHLHDPKLAVVLQVSGNSHWVVASGFSWLTRLFKIVDPWLGDRATMARYGDDISGAAYFRAKRL